IVYLEGMEEPVTLIIHHGGSMQWHDGILEYIGGMTFPWHIMRETLTLQNLHLFVTFDLKYDSLDNIWYKWPDTSMKEGLHEIDLVEDDLYGLLMATNNGDVHMYLHAELNDIPGGNTDPPPVEKPPTRDEPPPIQSSDDDGDNRQQ
ncbi:hypothetical protein LINGRAHAP2_LOCUS9317, partial [Linum grandiflorum]